MFIFVSWKSRADGPMGQWVTENLGTALRQGGAWNLSKDLLFSDNEQALFAVSASLWASQGAGWEHRDYISLS